MPTQIPVLSEEVWNDWPEFQELAKRLGIDKEKRVVKLVITLEAGAWARVEQTYLAEDHKDGSL